MFYFIQHYGSATQGSDVSFEIIFFQISLANHENPELIWNDDAREKVSQTSQKFRDAYVYSYFYILFNSFFFLFFALSDKIKL